MKNILILLISFVSTVSLAINPEEACKIQAEKKEELNIISSKIAKARKTDSPGINIEAEMSNMITVTRDYEKAATICSQSKTANAACIEKADRLSKHKLLEKEIASNSSASFDKLIAEMKSNSKAYKQAEAACPMTKDEACTVKVQKKKEQDFLIAKISKNPAGNMDAAVASLKVISEEYKKAKAICIE